MDEFNISSRRGLDESLEGQAYPWVHIDMASLMTSVPSDNLAKGVTGEPVRLLLKVIEMF